MVCIYVGIYVPYVHNSRVYRDFMDSNLKKGNDRLGKQALGIARLVNDEEQPKQNTVKAYNS